MREVPRHMFVPEGQRAEAYEDHPLVIGEGQTISQPYMVAVMTEALCPGAGDHVLEIGTGSGYQTAVLARLSASVISIERHRSLADKAAARFHDFGIDNVHVVVGDGTEGWPDQAPFTRILVTAAARAVPAALQSQLADGGRLVIPIGPPGHQTLTTVERHGDRYGTDAGIACTFVPLVGPYGWGT